MAEKIKSYIIKVGFLLGTLSTIVLLVLFDRQRKKLSDLKLEAQQRELKKRLESIQDKAQKSEADYAAAHGDYLRLRNAIPGVFESLGKPKP